MKIEELKKFKEEIDYYRNKATGVTIKIEDRDPNFVYLIHTTTLDDQEIEDVCKNGLAYSGNEIWRTFNNLSQSWESPINLFKEKADLTSIEQVIVESCSMSFQCFLYKIPLAFFQPVEERFYPIPIWYYDKTYKPKFNISSSEVTYDMNEKDQKFFRIFPTLLLGYYDLKTNKFQRNSSYSYNINNFNGIYDRRQLIFLNKFDEYANLWKHNDYILSDEQSPFEETIVKICSDFNNQQNYKKK